MKILMTADAVGGVWSYSLELARALASHDVEVVIATMGPLPTAAQRADAATLENVVLYCSEFKLEWMEDPWADVERSGEWLQGISAREHVDLIHLNGYSHAVLPWNPPVLSVAHSCVFTWWNAVHGCDPPDQWATYRDHVVAGLSASDLVIAPTQAFLREMQATYDFATPARVINNGVQFPPPMAERNARRLPIAVAAGRMWDEAKDFYTLAEAAEGLKWNVYVAGDLVSPDGRGEAADSMHCLGRLPSDDMRRWLLRAAVFVHPARYEPFGLSVLEAARCGCALVLSDIPTLRELWDDAALFVPPKRPRELHGALHSLLEDKAVRTLFAGKAQARAVRFSAQRMAQEYLAAYRQLLAKGSKERAVA
jgi:glycosyltransferase involved in cell wall biosynthesis